MSNNFLDIEVCFALPDEQKRIFLKLPEGSTVQDALKQSQIFEQLQLDPQINKVGIFSKLVKMETLLRNHDRVEIYRPLLADPKEVRRRRAEAGKVMKKGAAQANS